MKKKLIAGLLMTAIVAFAFAGCGKKGEEGAKAEKDGQITIQVFSNLPDRTSGQGLIEQTLFDQYMKENPNIKIEMEELDDESYKTKFKAYASGSDMPDLINVWGQPSFLDEVIDAGLIAELNPEDYADYGFIEGSLEGFKKDGKLYGLARNTDVMAFYYNKNLFKKYGVEIPKTYDELLEACKTFKEAGIIPVSMDGSDKWPASIYVNSIYQQFEGAAATKDVKEAVKKGDYSNPAWKNSLELLKKSVEAGMFQTGFETTDYGTAMNLFTNEQAAMFYMGSWEMSMATNKDLSEDFKNNIGVFNMPSVNGKGLATDIAAWNGGGHAVTANSDVKEEAIKLLNYMYKPENWSKLCWENGVCMSAQNFSEYLTGKETPLQLEFVNLLNNSTNITGVTFNDLGTNEFKTVSEDGTIEFAIGQMSAEDFLKKMADTMTK